MEYILGVLFVCLLLFFPEKITGNQGKGFFSTCQTQADTPGPLLLGPLNVSGLYTGQATWGYCSAG